MLRPGIRRTAKMLDPGAYPPRQKWVRDVTAYEARPKMLDPGAYPPRQRWVRDVTAYSRANCGSVGLLLGALVQAPASATHFDEVGMRENLMRTCSVHRS